MDSFINTVQEQPPKNIAQWCGLSKLTLHLFYNEIFLRLPRIISPELLYDAEIWPLDTDYLSIVKSLGQI